MMGKEVDTEGRRTNLVDFRDDAFEELLPDWKDIIELKYVLIKHYASTNGTEMKKAIDNFHKAIWEMSTTAFDKPREIQVVIDGNDKLHISAGNPGYVTFGGQEEGLAGMKFPLKEWIHTHPFGQAFWSGTDMNTLNMYGRFLNSATVIGRGEKQSVFFRYDADGNDYHEYIQHSWGHLVETGEEE